MTVSEILAYNLKNLRQRIEKACAKAGRDPSEVRLIAVTKYVDAEVVRALVGLGVHDLGENRLQVAAPKIETLEDLPIRWHWIGTLQTNKVRKALQWFSVFHSIDRSSLVDAIERRLADTESPENKKLPVFLQVNVSKEPTKSGVSPSEAPALMELMLQSPCFDCQGLMTMAPAFEDPEKTRPIFSELYRLRETLRDSTGEELPRLSMGMSNDFEIAIEEGATDVRIGQILYEGLID